VCIIHPLTGIYASPTNEKNAASGNSVSSPFSALIPAFSSLSRTISCSSSVPSSPVSSYDATK